MICIGQVPAHRIDSFHLGTDIKVTMDIPLSIRQSKETIVCFFALPNGNSTDQTMGKKMKARDDWHFDIQHIRAQTAFIRLQLKKKNFVVIYLENDYKSWPSWKQKHADFKVRIPLIVDSLVAMINAKHKVIYLNGHSGGGSFIFGYLAGLTNIPGYVKRISFLDSDYGYDSTYYPKFKNWLSEVKDASLNVFAYNDSVALLDGKPFVSATGGTWWRSHYFLDHLSKDFQFEKTRDDSLIVYKSKDERIQFYFRNNPERKIYHTQQVEFNGFIHSILSGTAADSRKYQYYHGRAYSQLITDD
ncbi:MAG TPA: hypothetical protein VLJ68_13620 [Chitinophagaceae bacterium]|nr:hypothetical protein [Chitinophagaceae bacterium]